LEALELLEIKRRFCFKNRNDVRIDDHNPNKANTPPAHSSLTGDNIPIARVTVSLPLNSIRWLDFLTLPWLLLSHRPLSVAKILVMASRAFFFGFGGGPLDIFER